MRDGHLNKCKSCQKENVKAARSRNPEHYQAYERSRSGAAHRVEARNAYAKTDAGRVARSRAGRRYIERNPIKRAAHVMVNNALRSGLLTKGSCEVCGLTDVHGHHDDYALPLVVRWLCPEHHADWHKTNTPLLNGKPFEDAA